MRKVLFTLGVVAAAAVLATVASAASRGIEFTPLGFIQDPPSNYSVGINISADGTIVNVAPSPFGGCTTWTEAGGHQLIAIQTGTCYMSDDGMDFASRIADADGFEVSAKWNGTEFVEIPGQAGNASCDFLKNGTFEISGDGTTVGGLTWEGCSYARGFQYTDATGMEVREGILDDSSRVNNMDYDGSVAVGWNRIEWGGWQATRWDDGVPSWIAIDPSEGFLSEPWTTNSDASVIGGNIYPFATGLSGEGWVWSEAKGLQSTGALPWGWFFDQGYAFGVSEDGSIAVGRFGFGPFAVATLWTEETGLIDLNQFLIDQGRTEVFDGWTLISANDCTTDCKTITGYAVNPDNLNEAWVLDINKVSICHAPPGNQDNARTLNINWDSIGDHLAHGDFLGTCEAAVGFSRTASEERMAEIRANARAKGMHTQYLNPSADRGPTMLPDADFWQRLHADDVSFGQTGSKTPRPIEHKGSKR